MPYIDVSNPRVSAPTASAAPLATGYVFRLALVAALGGFLFGYEISIISGALIFLEKEFQLTANQAGYAVSSAAIGCIVGPLVSVALSDWLGRKKTLMVAAVLLGACAIITAFPRTMTEFYLGRIVGGI